jgi:hypothetical protein
MLWQRFAKDMNLDGEADARMSWGTKLEPLILDQAADDLRLEVRQNREPNGSQHYFRNGYFGCHRDGDIICPDRGPGAIEAKASSTIAAGWRTGTAGKHRRATSRYSFKSRCTSALGTATRINGASSPHGSRASSTISSASRSQNCSTASTPRPRRSSPR